MLNKLHFSIMYGKGLKICICLNRLFSFKTLQFSDFSYASFKLFCEKIKILLSLIKHTKLTTPTNNNALIECYYIQANYKLVARSFINNCRFKMSQTACLSKVGKTPN